MKLWEETLVAVPRPMANKQEASCSGDDKTSENLPWKVGILPLSYRLFLPSPTQRVHASFTILLGTALAGFTALDKYQHSVTRPRLHFNTFNILTLKHCLMTEI